MKARDVLPVIALIAAAAAGASERRLLRRAPRTPKRGIKEASSGLGLTPPTVGSAIERLEAAGYAAELTGQKRDRIWTSAAHLELVTGR